MIDHPAARAVAMVVQTGSFEAAARALHVTPSAVSQRVKQLEERLGTVLIERGTPCAATEQVNWICLHIEHLGMLERELAANLPGLADPAATAERVTLNIATNANGLESWFLDAVAPFTWATDYLLNIAIDDEDHTAEWLRRGGVLAAVTYLQEPVQGCRVAALGALRYRATASPAYIERYLANGVTPASMAGAPALTFNQKDTLQQAWLRRVFDLSVTVPTHWLPSTQSFVDASLAGMGWGMNSEQLVSGHMRSGRLVELVPGTPLDVPLYWQASRLAADRLGGLTRAVVSHARQVLVALA